MSALLYNASRLIYYYFMFTVTESGKRHLVHMFRARQRDSKCVSLTWTASFCISMFLKARCVWLRSSDYRFNRFLPMNGRVWSIFINFSLPFASLCEFPHNKPDLGRHQGFHCCDETHFLFASNLCVVGFGCYLSYGWLGKVRIPQTMET